MNIRYKPNERCSVLQSAEARLLPELTQHTHTTSNNLRQHFASLLFDAPIDQVSRVCLALEALQEQKSSLIGELSEGSRVSFRPSGGLGANCISCVESYVTPILTDLGIETEMISGQYPFEWRGQRGLPPIYAYNILNFGSSCFIVDYVGDPFHGTNIGAVVAPLAANIPIYDLGFAYHRCSCSSDGEIIGNSCMLFDNLHGPRAYMDGDVAEHISIAPYHFEPDANRGPTVLPGGATLYYGYDKISDMQSNVFHSISLTYACRISTCTTALYNLYFCRVLSFHVRCTDKKRTTVSVVFDDSSRFELLTASVGSLLPNDYVSLRASSESMPQTVSVRLTGNSQPQTRVELPYWKQTIF